MWSEFLYGGSELLGRYVPEGNFAAVDFDNGYALPMSLSECGIVLSNSCRQQSDSGSVQCLGSSDLCGGPEVGDAL